MKREDIIEVHRVYNEIVLTQYLDKETLLNTYFMINGVHTQNLAICKRCITSFVMNHPIPEEETKQNKKKNNEK